MDIIYYIILGVTVVSYLLGLFLSHFERKGDVPVLSSSMGNDGFINIFGVSSTNSSRGFSQQEIQLQQGAQMSQHPFQMQVVSQEEQVAQQMQVQQVQQSQVQSQSACFDEEII